MKKIIALSLALLMLFSFAGCKKKDIDPAVTAGKKGDRISYNYNMSKYISLGTYSGISVDKSSDSYKGYYDTEFETLVANKNAYNFIKEGKLAKDDTAMIEYVGKIDGKEFQGGTSEAEGALVLGSGQFIPGFEDALIGKEIGKTAVINLNFPDDYDQTTYFADDKDQKNGFNLKGKAVEFTVKVNSVRELPEINDETATKLGYGTKDALVKYLDEVATENCVLATLFNSKELAVKSYPETEKARYDAQYNEMYAQAEQTATDYNKQNGTAATADDVLYSWYGQTSEQIKSYFDSLVTQEMVMFAIFDAEGLSYTEEEYNGYLEEIAKFNSTSEQIVTVDDIKENNEAWQLEAGMIFKVATKYLVKSATVK